MSIKIIAALSTNRVIGDKGKIPWFIRGELRRFKDITMGHNVVMGRKTFESIGKVLEGRRNIIISNNKSFQADGAIVESSFDLALSQCDEGKDIFIIGGSKIYELFEPVANSLAITRILKDFDGDAFFPDINWDLWQIEKEENFFDEKSNIECKLIEYSKKA